MITVNGVEFEFSFFNPDHVRRYEKTRLTVAQKYQALNRFQEGELSTERYAEILTEGCLAIFEFFDGILGEGTSNRLFGDETDFERCIDAFMAFEDGIQQQASEFGKKLERFSPNRATRAPADESVNN